MNSKITLLFAVLACFLISAQAINENVLNDEIQKILREKGTIEFDINEKYQSKFHWYTLDLKKGYLKDYTYENAVFSMTDDKRVLISGTGFQGTLEIDFDSKATWFSSLKSEKAVQKVGDVSFSFELHLDNDLTVENVKFDIGTLKFTNQDHKVFSYFATELEKLVADILEVVLPPVIEIGSKHINLNTIAKKLIAGKSFPIGLPLISWLKVSKLNLSNLDFGAVTFDTVGKDKVVIKMTDINFQLQNKVEAIKIIKWWKNLTSDDLVNKADLQHITVTLTFRLYENKGWNIDIANIDLDMTSKDTVHVEDALGNIFCIDKTDRRWCLGNPFIKLANFILKSCDQLISKAVTKLASEIVNTKGVNVGVNVKYLSES